MAESNAVHCVRVPKSSEEGSKLLKESVPKSTVSSFLIYISCYARIYISNKNAFPDH